MLTHHRLKVYEKALALGACAQEFSALWGRRDAFVDHFRRASESVLLNIAQGARLLSGPDKARTLDYALGSTLECAACVDIARIKDRVSREKALMEKRRIVEIARMLIGLRKAWLRNAVSEESTPYQADPLTQGEEFPFHHESLDVYQVGLDFMRWFVALPGAGELPDRLCREIDQSATGVILNVAEGNGRYSELDHQRFLEIAAASAVKTLVYLDLYQMKVGSHRVEISHGRELLSRVTAMLSRF